MNPINIEQPLLFNFDDETENEQIDFRYVITSYGADYPVDSLMKRIKDKVIFIPPFQRQFVWNINEASKFIESLILGLPVPGIFLSKEKDTHRLLVVDGQQRLTTLSILFAILKELIPTHESFLKKLHKKKMKFFISYFFCISSMLINPLMLFLK